MPVEAANRGVFLMSAERFYLGSYRILHRIAPRQVVMFMAGCISSLLYTPVQLLLTKAVVDRFQHWDGSGAYSSVLTITSILSGTMLISGAFSSYGAVSLSILQEKGDVEKERLIGEKTARLQLVDVESPSVAGMRDKAMKISFDRVVQDMGELTGRVLLIAVLLVFLAVLGHWGLALATCIITAFTMLVYNKSSEGTERLVRMQTGERRMMEYLLDLLTRKQSVREIRLFNAGRYLKEKRQSIFVKNKAETIRQAAKCEGIRLMPDLLTAVVGGVLAAAVIILVNRRGGTAGDFLVLFQSAVMVYGLLPEIASLAGRLKAYSIRWNDFEAFLNLQEEKQDDGGKAGARLDMLAVEVENLTFRYSNATRPAINNISFKIPAGSRVAVVGENRSGKSTLVKLLLGLYKPEKGFVRWMAGNDEKDITAVRQNASAVFQDYSRLNLTVRENVALGEIALLQEDECLCRALDKAGALNEFDALDVQLGASFGGIELSGGQWQRLASSRAYLNDSVFVLFDEPTAALDPRAEANVFNSFLGMAGGKSAVLVTHRLGAVKLVDHILVLKEGELVEQGTHEELIAAGGEYAGMYKLQAAWYKPTEETLHNIGREDGWSDCGKGCIWTEV